MWLSTISTTYPAASFVAIYDHNTFYVSVIVRPAEAAVASNNAILSKCLLEVTTKLKSIVSLHHLEMEAKKLLGIQDGSRGLLGYYSPSRPSIGHASI